MTANHHSFGGLPFTSADPSPTSWTGTSRGRVPLDGRAVSCCNRSMRRHEFSRVPRKSVEAFAPGVPATDFQPGGFILTHGNAWTSKIIRFGQRLRIHGDDRKYAYWNHAALIVNDDGALVEALGAGVERTNISR